MTLWSWLVTRGPWLPSDGPHQSERGYGMTQQLGGFVLSVVIFGLLIAISRGDGPLEWFRK